MSQSLDGCLFSLLPQKRPPWKQFLLSSSLQAAAVLGVVVAGLLGPDAFVLRTNYQFTRLVDPAPLVSRERAHSRPIRPPLVRSPEEPRAPVLVVRRESERTRPPNPVLEAPRVVLAKSEPVLLTVPVIASKLLVDTSSRGSSKTATIVKAPQLVQTGGFGDPNGIPAKMSNKTANIAQLGAFDLPPGNGKGNGTGGAKGNPGVVASAGFGSSVATGEGASGLSRAGSVQEGGFGDARASGPPTETKSTSTTSRDIVPAEILSKPIPVYTEEARRLHVEGEVLLEVVFQPSGTIDVLRVVRGLGHGLDESAIRAAQHIRFKPAMRDGQPAASSGVLHVVFQLA